MTQLFLNIYGPLFVFFIKYKYHENDLSYCACITRIFWIVC